MRGRVRGHPASHAKGRARGHTQGHAGISGRRVEVSSSFATPDDIFGGVPGGAQFFYEMAESIRSSFKLPEQHGMKFCHHFLLP